MEESSTLAVILLDLSVQTKCGEVRQADEESAQTFLREEGVTLSLSHIFTVETNQN